MPTQPDLYNLLKDFAGPVATVIAAIVAAGVVLYFNRAQIRLTRTQLLIDLFDMRWEIVQELRTYINSMIVLQFTNLDKVGEDFLAFRRSFARAKCLFGAEVVECLKEIEEAMAKYAGEVGAARKEGKARLVHPERLHRLSEKFELLIRPYITLDQKLPLRR